MAQTPWEMAAVGREFSHQSALFAWAAMARLFGPHIAGVESAYKIPGWAKEQFNSAPGLAGPILPELTWLHAIKNQGHGDRVRGSRSKAEGVREGVFDTFLPVIAVYDYGEPSPRFKGGGLEFSHGRWGYAGLYMELKTPDRINRKDGGASQPQLDFQAFAREQGYAAEVVHGWEAARDCLLTYLGKSPAS